MLCVSGIPICTYTDANGGYEVLSDFKINNQLASEDAYIATAINGLKAVTNNPVALLDNSTNLNLIFSSIF